jgi:hypothetical protein
VLNLVDDEQLDRKRPLRTVLTARSLPCYEPTRLYGGSLGVPPSPGSAVAWVACRFQGKSSLMRLIG